MFVLATLAEDSPYEASGIDKDAFYTHWIRRVSFERSVAAQAPPKNIARRGELQSHTRTEHEGRSHAEFKAIQIFHHMKSRTITDDRLSRQEIHATQIKLESYQLEPLARRPRL